MMSRATLAIASALLIAGEARAQVFTMPVRSGSARENEPGGINGTLQPTQPIGRRDCTDEEWSFLVNYTGTGGATRLEYWIGVDEMACATAANRHPVASGTPRCWPVSQTPSLSYINPTVPLSYTVRIRSRYLVSPLTGDCADLQTTQGNIATNYLTLLASPPSDNNIVGTYAIAYDIEPPLTPTDVTLSAGENSVNVQWSYAGSTTTSTSADDGGTTSSVPRDLQGFWLLCDPPPGGGATDASVGDGGRDASIGLDVETDDDAGVASCGTAGFEQLDANDDQQFQRYRCSDLISAASTRGVASGLDNGVAYRVAVVAQDLAGNRSTLGLPSTCVRPQPLTDFWEHYRGSGGVAEPLGCGARPGRSAGGAMLAIGAMMSLALRRRRRARKTLRAAAWLLAAAATLTPSLADAQTFQIFGSRETRRRWESPQHFLFELRGGPFYPDVDGEFSGRATPFADIYGRTERVLLSGEFDWQILRIYPVGSLGLGVSAGYTIFGAVAPVTQTPMPAPSAWTRPSGGQETSLHVIPGFIGGVFRADGLARHTVVPLVPYVKFGLGYAYWWSTLGENLSRRSATGSPNVQPGDTDIGVAATGLSLGTHLAVGLMLRLDFLEASAQRRWDSVMGVNHSYLFGEYTRADVGTSGTQLQLSSETWNVGLAFEF